MTIKSALTRIIKGDKVMVWMQPSPTEYLPNRYLVFVEGGKFDGFEAYALTQAKAESLRDEVLASVSWATHNPESFKASVDAEAKLSDL